MSSRKQVIKNKRGGRAFQSKAAKMLQGKSVGTIENQDISHNLFSIEAKKRKKFIGKTFMEQAVKNCPEDRIPLVIVHETNDRHINDLIIIRYQDWIEMIKKYWDSETIEKYGLLKNEI